MTTSPYVDEAEVFGGQYASDAEVFGGEAAPKPARRVDSLQVSSPLELVLRTGQAAAARLSSDSAPKKGKRFLTSAIERDMSPTGEAAAVLRDVGHYTKEAGKDALRIGAAAGDMILGAPARLAGKVMNVGSRLATQDAPRELQGQAGAAAEHLGPFESLKSPLSYMAQLFAGTKPIEPGVVEHAMEAMNAGISKYTGGLLTTADAGMLTETALDILGVKTIKPMVKTMTTKPPPRGIENQRTPGILEGEVLPRAEAAVDASQARIARQGRTIDGEAATVVLPPAALPKPRVEMGAADPKLLAWIAGASGGALYVANEGLGNLTEEGIGGLTALGAVKAKGGMWHPEAVRRLAAPLETKLAYDPAPNRPAEAQTTSAIARVEAAKTWSSRAIINYLNKHAGTEGDPLAGVEVPYTESSRTWGEVVDDLIKPKKFKDLEVSQLTAEQTEAYKQGKISPDEPLYDIRGPRAQGPRGEFSPAQTVSNYLSHVGDYLLENVAPEKLGQYDLVRAVKETAKWDAEAAKRMERAAKEQTDALPVYKDYGDGYKWVEVKGKDAASTKAALQHEGDTMGHCVGGYCDYVESGDSKIYSLRDSKGRSHVTVEVAPRAKNVYNRPPTASELEPSILQIKGKQNRAPVAEYLPYVQDFVKSGKWGEVGDLENTALYEAPESVRSITGRYATNQEIIDAAKKNSSKNLAGVQEYLKEQVARGNEPDIFGDYPGEEGGNPPPGDGPPQPGPAGDRGRQRGAVDPKLARVLAAGATGAAIGAAFDASQGNDDIDNGAFIGGVAGALLATKGGKAVRAGVDYYIGNLSTQLAKVAPPLRRRLRDLELEVRQEGVKVAGQLQPFIDAVKKLSPEAQERLKIARLSDDPSAIAAAMQGNPALVDGYRRVQNFLRENEVKSKAMGRFAEGLVNYFPRTVKDLDGLKEALDLSTRKGLDEVLYKAEVESLDKHGRGMTPVEQSLVIDRYLTRSPATSGLPGYAHQRGVKDVTEALSKFYDDPIDSLVKFAMESVSDQAKAKFFGKDIRVNKDGTRKFTDVDASIGAVFQRLLSQKEITPEQAAQGEALLRARFLGGEEALSGPLQDVRNLNNLGLLGSIDSAMTQLGDSVFQIYHQAKDLNPLYYIESVARTATGKGISPKDFGLANHISEELSSSRATGKALAWVFKPFFAPIDRLGKGIALTGPFLRMKELVKTPAGIEKLREKWGRDYGDDFPQLVEDLQNATREKRTELVDSVLWQELSNTQPVSMSENSPHYNEAQVGRLFHNMKTFTEKQLDVLRRDAYDNIASGEPKRVVIGLKNLALLATVLAFSNIPGDTVKSWLSGIPLEIDEPYVLESILKNFGVGRYNTEQVGKGQAWDAVVGVVAPPFKQWQDLYNAARDPTDRNVDKLVKLFPWIGKTYYNQELGGKEEAAIHIQARKRAEEKARKMTPEQADHLQREHERKRIERGRKAFKDLEAGRIDYEVPRNLTYSDTPASDELVYDGFTSNERPRVVRNRYDFARHSTQTPARLKHLDEQDERRDLVNEANRRFGRTGERAAMKLLMERELRQPKRGRVQG